MVAITPVAMKALDAIRPVGVDGGQKVFGLSESQIARRVKVIAKAAVLGHAASHAHEIERQGRWKQGGGMVGRYTRGESAGSALRYL